MEEEVAIQPNENFVKIVEENSEEVKKKNSEFYTCEYDNWFSDFPIL